MRVDHWTVSSQQELEDAFTEMGFIVGDTYVEGVRGAYFAADDRQSEMDTNSAFMFLDFAHSVKNWDCIFHPSNNDVWFVGTRETSPYLQIYKLNLYGGGVILQIYGTNYADLKQSVAYKFAVFPEGDTYSYIAVYSGGIGLDKGDGNTAVIKTIKVSSANMLGTNNEIMITKAYDFMGSIMDAEVYQLLYSPSIPPNQPYVFELDNGDKKYLAAMSSTNGSSSFPGDRLVFRLSDEY